jgi:hypothetical protein
MRGQHNIKRFVFGLLDVGGASRLLVLAVRVLRVLLLRSTLRFSYTYHL